MLNRVEFTHAKKAYEYLKYVNGIGIKHAIAHETRDNKIICTNFNLENSPIDSEGIMMRVNLEEKQETQYIIYHNSKS